MSTLLSLLRCLIAVAVWASGSLLSSEAVLASETGDEFALSFRYQEETTPGSGTYHRLVKKQNWKASETAVIVCDVWDLHHSQNAVRRLEEFAPRLNDLLTVARERGATIIHSPSDCMAFYDDHPARRRAVAVPAAQQIPDDIASWCSRIPNEEAAVYPIDQTDGGDDDDPQEHAAWVKELHRRGRNPDMPWQRQSELISIDAKRDYISDRGEEVWSLLERRGIQNVILTGVHTNMCVLGRPFGLRQMVRNGKNVVLVRDMTDTMYNPGSWPYVSHFTGTDLIVSHIERFVCPTVTSDQIIGGDTFRSKHDNRPHLVMVIAEDEYETHRTLPRFASQHLGQQFRVSLVFGHGTDRNLMPGLEVLETADVALISARRRTLRPDRLAIVRRFVESGKPVVGIRTASHAFSLRRERAPEGYADWPEFDAEVFGGSYTNHHGNKLKSTVAAIPEAAAHPILDGVTSQRFAQGGSLYMAAPLASGTTPLMTGRVEGASPEPVAWTFLRRDGGKSFYTSMGEPSDFDNRDFLRLLRNGICWAAGVDSTASISQSEREGAKEAWSLVLVPASNAEAPSRPSRWVWYRCAVRLRDSWIDRDGVFLEFPDENRKLQVWWNGTSLQNAAPEKRWPVAENVIEVNDANLLVVRLSAENGLIDQAPQLRSGPRQFALRGRWQRRFGDDPSWSNIALPARYGTSTDIVFEP